MLIAQNSNECLTRCMACPAHMSGPCQGACLEALGILSRASQTCSYAKGETIIYQGEEPRQVGIIVSGVVKLTNVGVDGRHTVVALLENGSVVGSLTGTCSRFAFEAASPVTICSMPQRAFMRVLKEYPEVACRVLELSLKQSEEVQEWLTLFNCRTTLQRLAGYLHARARSQSRNVADGDALPLEMPIGRKDLAAYLGTTPETLSRNFHRLAAMNVLTIIDGAHVVVINVARLADVACESSEELQSLSHAVHEGQVSAPEKSCA